MHDFEPTTFDKAVSRVLTYLKTEKKLQYTQFADEVDLMPQSLSAIIALKRGVPIHKKDMFTYILREKYKVNPRFLITNEGPFLSTPLPVKIEEVPQYAQLVKEMEGQHKRIMELEKQIQYYEQLVQSQSTLITNLQDAIKSAKK